ncbi:MAG: hypothetical protein JXR96_20785 [Deltaproteobacteria bacterium]|nr:hypothetical protein [Deltaproteobacteria bacterium]
MRWAAIVLLCAWPALARSADELEQAEQLRKRMQYEQAIERCAEVLESSGREPRELVAAYRIMGLSLSASGKLDQAFESFKKLLAIDPGFKLSPRISPKLAAPFFQARALLEGQKPITLVHAPPPSLASPEAFSGAELAIELAADPLGMVKEIAVRYRVHGVPQDLEVRARIASPGKVVVRLPDGLQTRSITYLIEARNAHNSALVRLGEKKRFELVVAERALEPAVDEPVDKPVVADEKPAGDTQPRQEGEAYDTPQPEQAAFTEAPAHAWFEVQVHACVMGNEIFGHQGGDAGVALSRDPVVGAQMGLNRYGGGLRGGVRIGAYHFAYLHFDYLWEEWSGYAGASRQMDWSSGFQYVRILAGYRFAYPVLDWLEPFAECALGAHVYVPRTLRIDIGGEIDEAEIVPDTRFALMLGFGVRFVFLEHFFATGSYLIDMPIDMSSSSFVLGGGAFF